MTGPLIISAYEELETDKRLSDGHYMVLMCYGRSLVRDCENYLRIVVGLDEEDIQLILKQYKLNFVTYDLSAGIYSIKDFQRMFTRWVIMTQP